MTKNNKNKNSVRANVKSNKLKLVGKGDYNVTSDEFSQLQSKLDKIESRLPNIKSGLESFGSKIGGMFGSSELGKRAGSGVSKLLGFGDYTIMSNSLMKATADGVIVPKFDNKGTNGIRVREREYLGDVVSGTANSFLNRVYPITPTASETFPWLSTIAHQFDQWEPNGLVFEFISTSSDFNGSAQGLGSIVMATDYDVTEPPYPNKIVMDNADYSSSGKPSVNQMHGVECDTTQRPYRVMYTKGVDATTQNRNTLGNFQIASAGVSANTVTLGELWVSYDITFYKKQLLSAIVPSYTINGNYNTGTTVWVVNTQTNHVGWRNQVENIATAPNQRTIFFPPGITNGRYLCQAYLTSAGISSLVISPLTNCTLVQSRDAGDSTVLNDSIQNILVDVSAENATLLLSLVSTTGFELSITKVPSDFDI